MDRHSDWNAEPEIKKGRVSGLGTKESARRRKDPFYYTKPDEVIQTMGYVRGHKLRNVCQ